MHNNNNNNNNNFICPNCSSTKHIGIITNCKKYNEGPYKNVDTVIQCNECFMDIPSILCENIQEQEKEKITKIWIDIYKPFHKLDAAKCSKCLRYYWEIEKYLFKNNIKSKDIFYQTYNPKKEIGNLVCKICDPSAFK